MVSNIKFPTSKIKPSEKRMVGGSKLSNRIVCLFNIFAALQPGFGDCLSDFQILLEGLETPRP